MDDDTVAPSPPERKSKSQAAGSAMNAVRDKIADELTIADANELLNMKPDIIVSKDDKLTGNLTFGCFLRMDGAFEGSLLSPPEAGVYVGPYGRILTNIWNLGRVYVEGTIIGSICHCQSVVLQSSAKVHGDISCRSLEAYPGSEISGSLWVSASDEYPKLDKRGRIRSLKPKRKDCKTTVKSNTVLLLIEPQLDFHNKAGSSPVAGAEEDTDAVSEMIRDHYQDIDEIVVVLDGHQRGHIANQSFWVCGDGTSSSPPIGAVITESDVANNKWIPRNKDFKDHCLEYLTQIAKEGRYELKIKPDHCLFGSKGHAMVPWIASSIAGWSKQKLRSARIVDKCRSLVCDSTSIIWSDDGSVSLDQGIMSLLQNASKVIVSGLSNSPNAQASVRDIVKLWGPDCSKLYIVRRGIFDLDTEKDEYWISILKSGANIRHAQEVFIQER